jgi:hypothetical protein
VSSRRNNLARGLLRGVPDADVVKVDLSQKKYRSDLADIRAMQFTVVARGFDVGLVIRLPKVTRRFLGEIERLIHGG